MSNIQADSILYKLLYNDLPEFTYTSTVLVFSCFLLNYFASDGPEDMQSAERVTVGEGGAATVECTAAGNPTPHLTWTKDGHNR